MMILGVSSDRVTLIFGRVFLVLGRHAHIFGRPDFLGLHVAGIFRFVTLVLNQLDIPTCVRSYSPSPPQPCRFEPEWVCDRLVIFSVFSNLKHGEEECRFAKRAEKFGPFLENLF